jgi:hypothetical protein
MNIFCIPDIVGLQKELDKFMILKIQLFICSTDQVGGDQEVD